MADVGLRRGWQGLEISKVNDIHDLLIAPSRSIRRGHWPPVPPLIQHCDDTPQLVIDDSRSQIGSSGKNGSSLKCTVTFWVQGQGLVNTQIYTRGHLSHF